MRRTADPDNHHDAAAPADDSIKTRRHILTAGAAAAGAALTSGVLSPSTASAQTADTSTQNTFTDKQTFAASPTFFQQSKNSDIVRFLDSSGNMLGRFTNIASGGGFAGAFGVGGSNGTGPGSESWSFGIDTAAAIPYRDFFLSKNLPDGSVHDPDGIYLSHNGDNPSSVGIGQAAPGLGYRLTVSAPGSDLPGMGGLGVTVSPGQTGNLFSLRDVGGAGNPDTQRDRWFVDTAFKATFVPDGDTTRTALQIVDLNQDSTQASNAGPEYSGHAKLLIFEVRTGQGGQTNIGSGAVGDGNGYALNLQRSTNSNVSTDLRIGTPQGSLLLSHSGSSTSPSASICTNNGSRLELGVSRTANITLGPGRTIGFFGQAAASRPTLSYSRNGARETPAVAALRVALASLGLVADNTTS